MLTIYDTMGLALVKHDPALAITEQTVWFDLVNPTVEEDHFVEQALGISIPTRAEMREIEASRRFYQEGGASYMTAFILYNSEQSVPASSAMTFVLAGKYLVTVRYCEPKAFPLFLTRVERGDATFGTGAAIMIGLLESIVQRMADLIERIQDQVDKLANDIFDLRAARRDPNRRLEVLLKGTGTVGDIVARAQESATSLDRVLHFFANAAHEIGCESKVTQRIAITERDIASLSEHMKFVSGRINFLLDATLGVISTEQNKIIKLFSVMAVMLMPPTLVASIYGMNFHYMPELSWLEGYPIAIAMMFVSALIPYIYFRRKGWL
ncbi:MAG TPA: magnesium transporter CorA family protein [Hyphomicrobiaceae bacterium]|nr:magnesium transporter CorA family protein [Hyphomicrobiaceae bacterium]